MPHQNETIRNEHEQGQRVEEAQPKEVSRIKILTM